MSRTFFKCCICGKKVLVGDGEGFARCGVCNNYYTENEVKELMGQYKFQKV